MSSNDSSDNKALLIVIAVFCAITALGTIVGLAIWAYSWWQTQQLVDDLLTPADDAADIATGTWSGSFSYPNGDRIDISFVVRESNPVAGSMTFANPTGGQSCVVSVTESDRSYSTVTVTTEATSGPSNCADTGRWEIVVDETHLTGELVSSSGDGLVGARLDLRPS